MCDVDLTSIDKPFGELDRATQLALFTAWLDGDVIELKQLNVAWVTATVPSWASKSTYRVRGTPDSIDWSHVHLDYKYMTRDENDEVWLWTCLPTANVHFGWWNTPSKESPAVVTAAKSHASYEQGTVHWTDSLVERPE